MAKTGTFVDTKTREQIRTPGYYDEIYSADGTERLDHRLERIDSDLTNLLFIKSQVLSKKTIPSGSGEIWAENVASISDYTPIGIVGFNTGHVYFLPQVVRILSGQVQLIGLNTSAVTLDVTPDVIVLYMKNV